MFSTVLALQYCNEVTSESVDILAFMVVRLLDIIKVSEFEIDKLPEIILMSSL